MKQNILFFALMVLLPSITFAKDAKQSNNQIGDLTVYVVGLKSNKGKLKIALSGTKENYKKTKNAFRGVAATIKNNKSEWLFKNIPYGEYAVKMYHDQNGNNKFDRNFLGLPKESYAFSNNAKANLGPAKWEDAKFDFKSKNMTIEIKIQ
jgi:uncharacterized protein (DUF2141 family)